MIYLDNHATTRCDPRVVDAMLPFFCEQYGNPSSEIHSMGRKARQTVEKARAQVASLIGAQPEEIIFTSSATESNNIALLGIARSNAAEIRKTIACASIEHKSVLGPCRQLALEGFELTEITVDNVGRVQTEAYKAVLKDTPLLVSIQAANNEIGTIQDIATFSNLAHECGTVFHCDAAQAVGKIPVNVETLSVDLLSVSAHKMYGPKGVGALYIRDDVSKSRLKPISYGGDQEYGLRPGTLNVPLIAGFGEACQIASEVMSEESARIGEMRDTLEAQLIEQIPGIKRNGDIANRLPGNSNLTFPRVDAEALIMSMPDLALSTGSACNSGAQEPSYVLKAIGLSHEKSNETLRIGLGRFNKQEEITAILGQFRESMTMLL